MVEAGLGVSAMLSADHPILVSVPLIAPQVPPSGPVYRREASLSPAAETFVSILSDKWPYR